MHWTKSKDKERISTPIFVGALAPGQTSEQKLQQIAACSHKWIDDGHPPQAHEEHRDVLITMSLCTECGSMRTRAEGPEDKLAELFGEADVPG